MKACILTIVDMSRLSMTMAYTDYFKSSGIDYDIIFYDKFGEYRNCNNPHLFPLYIDGDEKSSSIKKTIRFWKMRSKVKELLSNGKYDLIVVWNEVTAFIYGGMLRKYFPGKYTINIRDYFYLDKPFVHSELRKTISKSIFSTVSSKKYLDYLPKGDYIFLHSLNKGIVSGLEKPKKKAIDRPIRIEYIGQIGWLDNTFRFVDAIGKDDRFEALFYGTGSEQIADYARNKGYNNIITKGKFPPDRTAEYLEDADILYNLYGYGNIHLDSALSIKLYYAIYLGIPILTYAGTTTDEIANLCGIGYSIHGNENMESDLSRLYDWYQEYDLIEKQQRCDTFIREEIEQSYNLFHKKIDAYLEEIKND